MASTLYIGNLPYSATGDQLKDLFSQAGNVVSASVISDKFSGRSKGFGFVDMATAEEAQAAIEKFNGYSMEGREIKVNEARPREERPRGSFGGGNKFGGSRGGFGRNDQ